MGIRPIFYHLGSSFGNLSSLWIRDSSQGNDGQWADSLELLGIPVIYSLSKFGRNQTEIGKMVENSLETWFEPEMKMRYQRIQKRGRT